MTNQVLRDEYVSPFYDKSVLQRWLEDKPELATGAREIAAAFGIQMAASPTWQSHSHSNLIAFYTKEGLPAGSLYLKTGYSTRTSGHKSYFVYKSPLVSKDRASSRSERDERDSEKITGIISSLKKNGETPTLDKIKNNYKGGVYDAYQTVGSTGRHGPSVALSSDQSKALLKYIFADDKISIESHRMDLQKKYDSYLDELEKHKDSKVNIERFKKGCKIIGIISDKMTPKTYYLVGDSTYDGTPTIENLVRYESLSDSPLAGDVAMIRTYLESTPHFVKDNEVGIECRDIYLEDIDVAVGYRRYDQGTWVLIPKHGF